MPGKAKKRRKKAASKPALAQVGPPKNLKDAVDAVSSAIAMSVIARHGSKKDRAAAVAWLKAWWIGQDVFTDSRR